jgi:putative acetyltransferase
MYEQYRDENSFYYVVECDGEIVGGCGINALVGAGKEYCELQRMFLLGNCRGKGIAQQLMDKCLQGAMTFGYSYCYLETIKEFKAAVRLYKKNGFEHVYGPIGNTGHFSCEIKMVKPLTES